MRAPSPHLLSHSIGGRCVRQKLEFPDTNYAARTLSDGQTIIFISCRCRFPFLLRTGFHFFLVLVSISSSPFPHLHFSSSFISILPFLHCSSHFSSSVYCPSSIPPFLQSDCRNCERAMACALTSRSFQAYRLRRAKSRPPLFEHRHIHVTFLLEFNVDVRVFKRSGKQRPSCVDV